MTVPQFSVAGPDTVKAKSPLSAPSSVVMPVPLLSVVAAVNTIGVFASPSVNAAFVVCSVPANRRLLGAVTVAPLGKLNVSVLAAPKVNTPVFKNGVMLLKVLLAPVTVKA